MSKIPDVLAEGDTLGVNLRGLTRTNAWDALRLVSNLKGEAARKQVIDTLGLAPGKQVEVPSLNGPMTARIRSITSNHHISLEKHRGGFDPRSVIRVVE